MVAVASRLQSDFIEEVRSLFGHEAELLEQVLESNVGEDLSRAEALRPGDSFSFYSLPLYVVCRLARPTVVLETGTQNGGSAQAILCALRENDHGMLYSIDSGERSTDGTHVDTSGEPGAGISPHLRTRWRLSVGFTSDVLPNLLEDLGAVDLFFHDSDHAKECVEFEFREVLNYCHEGSLVGLHDHYGQWDWQTILKGWRFVVGQRRPQTHQLDGSYHNVLRLWQRW